MLPVVVIPAYQPDEKLLDVVNQLLKSHPDQKFIIVDDGSTLPEAKKIFGRLSANAQVSLLKHAQNQGKGKALKTAFGYFLENFPDSPGVVTADADGQHLAEDILSVSSALKDSAQVVLGVRVFNDTVPGRSRLGNQLTAKIFAWFSGKSLQDTQTGLRAIAKENISDLLKIEENGYAFEMNMLMQAIEKHWEIKEVPIQTVYIEQNRSSHFNPVKDSLKIYFVFIRYSVLSLISAILDLILFFSFFYLTQAVAFSTAGARLLSGIFNFICGKQLIFKSTGKVWPEAFQYCCLAVTSIIFSSLLVSFLFYKIKLNIYASKMLADTVIFLCNFTIQRFLIFRLSHTSVNSASQ
jgi:glycosyltransferase involved in cell wall biosynthesis